MRIVDRAFRAVVFTAVAACSLALWIASGAEFVVQTLFQFGPTIDFSDGSPVTTNLIATGPTASATTAVTGSTQVLYRVTLLP